MIGYALVAKLTDDEVVEIRRMRRDGKTYREIAREFGVDQSTASNAARGETYSHIPDPVDTWTETRQRDPMFEAAQMGMSWNDAKQYKEMVDEG